MGLPCGQVVGWPEDLDQAGLDLVGDDVLPPPGLQVGLLPREPDDVGQQPLGQAVLAHHALGHRPASLGQEKRTTNISKTNQALQCVGSIQITGRCP